MAYFHNVQLVSLLLLVALAPKLYGIDVTHENIYGTEARPIRYLSTSENWDELIDIYMGLVSTGQQPIHGVPFHPGQTAEGQAPPYYVPIDVVGRDETIDRTRLLIRADNGYLIGFTNWTGHYHLFEGPNQNLIPQATILQDIGPDYKSLLGKGARKNLPDLPLSHELFVDDAHTFGTYPASSTEEMKKSAARYVVMICEASRIKPIRQKISANLGAGVFYLDDMDSKYTVLWGLLSLQLLCDDQGIALEGNDKKALKRLINVRTAEQGRSILGIAIQTRRFKPNDPQESCCRE